MNEPSNAAEETVNRWWPAIGSCRLGEECPHEVAAMARKSDMDKRAAEIAADPKVRADIEEFERDVAMLHAGGVEADELRKKWYDSESSANLRMLMRELQDTQDAKAERDAARARADKATELLRRSSEATSFCLDGLLTPGSWDAIASFNNEVRAFLADIETETER